MKAISVLAAVTLLALTPGAAMAIERAAPQAATASLQAQIDALRAQVAELQKQVDRLHAPHNSVCIAIRCA